MSEHSHSSPGLEIRAGKGGGTLRYIPVFLYIFILYLIGQWTIGEPRATLFAWGSYHLSWVEVLYLCASIIALFEQMKVSHPGIDNTLEALMMVGMGVVQLVLFVLGAAHVQGMAIFNNTEFFMLMVISMAAAVVAVLINARTLRRTIGVGDD